MGRSNLTQRASGNFLLAKYDYQLDATVHRTNAVEIILGSNNTSYVTNNISWTYDGMYRLTHETRGTTTDTYAYDLVGNRKTKTTGAATTTYGYNANDRLTNEVTDASSTAYGYDSNGSLTNRTITGTGAATYAYTYNLQNQLSGVTTGGNTTSYVYNELGIRVRSTTGGTPKCYLTDPNNHTGYTQVLEELSTLGGAPTMSYVLGNDVLSQSTNGPSPVTSYLLCDGHNSTRQLVSGASHVSDRYDYDAYGQTLGTQFTAQNPPATTLLYGGEQWDVNAQQYYLRARYYDPSNGRFNAMDQMDGTPRDPQSLHKYAYCQNDPVTGRDPSGHQDLISTMVAEYIASTLECLYDKTIAKIGDMLKTSGEASAEAIDHMENGDAKFDTATIIIHGVNGISIGDNHKFGWSKEFQNDLSRDGDSVLAASPLNHDFYEFNWGGFGLNICGPVVVGILPIKSVHEFAFVNLHTAQLLIWMKGYANMDIISHSWGTCLAYDLLNSGGIEMHDWVTTGSPLNHDISKPVWNTGLWLNCYSTRDPVVYFDIYPTPFYFPQCDIGLIGHPQVDDYVDSTDYSGSGLSITEHGAYWTHKKVLNAIRNDLQ